MDCDAPRPLEYMPKERDCLFPCSSPVKTADEDALELTLGPPGEESRAGKPYKSRGNHSTRRHPSYSYLQLCPDNNTFAADKESSQPACRHPQDPPVNTAARNNNSQKRSAPAAVVGWPPILSFRRNLASPSGTKQPGPETRNVASDKGDGEKKPAGVPPTGLFVKINMDGVPIGRKVDLGSCESYEKLTTMVDELFCGLLAAQTDPSGQESEKPITGLLDGTGGYTLVYEDHEGDRVLVGDVPWQMFVATARRLRVLKRSDLSVHQPRALQSAGGNRTRRRKPLHCDEARKRGLLHLMLSMPCWTLQTANALYEGVSFLYVN